MKTPRIIQTVFFPIVFLLLLSYLLFIGGTWKELLECLNDWFKQ